MAVLANAQGIYTNVTKYDKFDDVEWTKKIKTLITKNDNTIVIETKGQKPVTYNYIDNGLMAMHSGDRDSLVNLIADVWGYESQYFAISEDLVNDVYKEIDELPDSLRITDPEAKKAALGLVLLSKSDKMPVITFRTISKSKYRFMYDTDLVWIKFEDGSRIIYTKDSLYGF